MPELKVEVRGVYEQTFSCGDAPQEHAPYILSVRIDIPSEVEAEFNRWYNEEHLPQLAAVPGVACARRYHSASSTGAAYLAIYEMENEHVMNTDAWSQAANTEWTNKLRPHFQAAINLGKRIF